MTQFRTFLRGAWGRQRTSASLALAFLAALTAAAVVTAQSDLDAPSPASGSAQVIAQGMTGRPDLRSAWRVVEREIPVRANARPSDRLEGAAGFLLADDVPLFVADQDTKLRYRLAPGEAQFVPIGANQTWASLESKPATAYTIELAVRETVDEAGGEVIFRSGSFGMTEGDYDLDLLRDTQPNNERTRLDARSFPILIFVTEGQIEVSSTKDGVETKRLSAGQAGAFEGDLTLRTRSRDDAVYVAAVVSASLGGGRTSAQPTETPSTEPTATEEPTAEPTATPEPTEEPPEPEPTATAEPTDEPEPTEAVEEAPDDPEEEESSDEPTEQPTATRTPVPESRTGSAELRLEVRVCPAGMRPESFDGDRCRDAGDDYRLSLVTPFGDVLRHGDANRANPGYIRWSDLKAGEYQLVVRRFPDGYDAVSLDGFLCCTPEGGFAIRFTRGTTLFGTLYFFRPV